MSDRPTPPEDPEIDPGGDLVSEPAPTAPIAPRPTRIPRFELDPRVRNTIMALLIIGALVGIFFVGRFAVTGADSTSENLPDAVDSLVPASGSEVLRQSQVGINLAEGYDAYLIINGTEIRTAEDGLIRDLGTGQILYQPGPDKPVETLNSGKNCIIAQVWDVLKTQSTAEPVSWCFDAT
jgi:hypothetical protein